MVGPPVLFVVLVAEAAYAHTHTHTHGRAHNLGLIVVPDSLASACEQRLCTLTFSYLFCLSFLYKLKCSAGCLTENTYLACLFCVEL